MIAASDAAQAGLSEGQLAVLVMQACAVGACCTNTFDCPLLALRLYKVIIMHGCVMQPEIDMQLEGRP